MMTSLVENRLIAGGHETRSGRISDELAVCGRHSFENRNNLYPARPEQPREPFQVERGFVETGKWAGA
jgi:hypothetical protein